MTRRMTVVAPVLTALLAGGLAGCSASGDPTAIRLCRHANLADVDDHGVGFRAAGRPKLVAAYRSTGRVLNAWYPRVRTRVINRSGHPIPIPTTVIDHPFVAEWAAEADGRTMAACYFDGSFSTRDGRTYERALVETDGSQARLIVADTRSVVPTDRPPRR